MFDFGIDVVTRFTPSVYVFPIYLVEFRDWQQVVVSYYGHVWTQQESWNE